jgi:RNA polymerase sigma factor (sigma-70 family)
MTSDLDLLGQYGRQNSQDAFAELVRRHLNLVYSAALRQVRSPQLAEEVAQSVFADLARNSSGLKADTILTAWLYQVTRHTAIDVVRRESRRQARESAAAEMADMNSTASDWLPVEPLLDEAMDTLDTTDRIAVLLRYFENKSLREIGATLGTSDDAAQKRVSRAVERLREFFAKRGVTVGASGLAVALSSNAVQAAPIGLAAGISSATLAAAATGTGATFTWWKLMTTSKLQAAIIGVVVVAGVATPLIIRHQAKLRRENQPSREQRIQPKADNDALAFRTAPVPRPPAPAAGAPGLANPPRELSPYEKLEAFLESRLAPSREELEASQRENRAPKPPEVLPRQDIEADVARTKRSAESLLAAYRLSRDSAYLREAATNFPNTSFVQFAVIADKIFPGEQRKWIDALKTSAPDNALTWYFSALDYFNAKQPDQAIQELAEAMRRQTCDTYTARVSQAVEEMCLLAGWPPLAAKAWAASSESAFCLPSLKQLADQMRQRQQEDLVQGDIRAAHALASMGMALGNALRTGSPITQLVGIAIEKQLLEQLDPSVTYDFLGRPAGEMLAELDRQKQDIHNALTARDRLLPTLNENGLAGYFERKKRYGEVDAVLWLQAQQRQP